jgi:hypothetical protein
MRLQRQPHPSPRAHPEAGRLAPTIVPRPPKPEIQGAGYAREPLPERRPRIEITPQLVVAVALGALVAVMWLRVLAGMAEALPAPVSDAAAGMRWSVALTSERIDDFVQSHGRTPGTLLELGDPACDLIEYRRISEDRYQLAAPSPQGPIVFDSIRPRQDFLGGRELARERAVLGIAP